MKHDEAKIEEQRAESLSTQLKLKVKLTGGHLLSRKNMARITARASEATDRWGNRLVNGRSPCDSLAGEPPYFRVWKIKEEAEGFIFLEVSSGHGICGHHKTIRKLVIQTLMLGIPVTVDADGEGVAA